MGEKILMKIKIFICILIKNTKLKCKSEINGIKEKEKKEKSTIRKDFISGFCLNSSHIFSSEFAPKKKKKKSCPKHCSVFINNEMNVSSFHIRHLQTLQLINIPQVATLKVV